jgi:hypothetical protein
VRVTRTALLAVGGLAVAGLAAAAVVGVTGLAARDGDGAQPSPSGATPPASSPRGGTVAERVAEAAQAGARTAAELAAAAGLPVDGPGSMRVAADGTVSATVLLSAPPTPEQLDAIAAVARIERVYTAAPAVAVQVDPARLDELAAIAGVVSAAPDLAPATS